MVQEYRLPDRLQQLEAWVDQGFEVEGPVLHRGMLHGPNGRTCVFEVVMRRGNDRRVLALCEDQAVYQWLHDAKVQIVNI